MRSSTTATAASRPPPPSRWDALQRDNKQSTTNSNSNRSTSCRANNHSTQGRGRQSNTVSRRSGNSTEDNFNWRRRTANNEVCRNDNDRPKASVEEDAVREAIHKLQLVITSKDEEEVQYCIQQVATSIFGMNNTVLDDPCAEITPQVVCNSTTSTVLQNISNATVFETSYSLLRHVQLLSQTKEESKEKTNELIQNISLVVLSCLESFIFNQQSVQNSDHKHLISDLRLCECATIIINVLDCDRYDDNVNTDGMLLCKATLFSCLAKILTISTRNTRTQSSSSSSNTKKNTRDKRGPLFPWGAEKTVNLVVKQSILPYIEYISSRDDIESSKKVKYCYGAMECLYQLLQDANTTNRDVIDLTISTKPAQLSKHAAAILAPLVLDVLADGKESQRTNPLRSRTLTAISSFWDWTYNELTCDDDEKKEHTHSISVSCQYMSVALNALSALKKGKTQNTKAEHDIDVSTVTRQLQSMMQNEKLQTLQPQFLNLLTLLCLAYPNASASQWYMFIERSAVKQSSLLLLLEQGTTYLENQLIEDECLTILPSALCATSALLTAMPFTLWITGDSRPSFRTSGGNLSSRVRNALLGVLECIHNLMTAIKGRISRGWLSNDARSMENVMTQLSQIAGKLCTILPFTGENATLLKPARLLVECAGRIYVECVNSFSSKRLITRAELDHNLLYKAMSSFGHVITECLGNGSSGCSNPGEKWLVDGSSFDFIGLLLSDSCWTPTLAKDRLDMLSIVASASPSTFSREPFNLASFSELCEVQCASQNDVNSRISGLKLIESFLLGRKRCVMAEHSSISTVTHIIPETFYPLLLTALTDNSTSIRSSAVSSFGSILSHDWIRLLHLEPGNESQLEWVVLESILRLCCANKEKVASVRASSCKAIGDISVACIRHDDAISDDFVHSFTDKICEAMAISLSDDVASVRSMALFAIGNTALALKEYYIDRSIPCTLLSMQHIFPLVCDCLSDKDEKVVANAIRSISHTAYFVYHQDYVSEDSSSLANIKDTCSTLISQLLSKVNVTLIEAVGDTPTQLTWKQRNGAKKQSWGACTTLGTLLSFKNLLPVLDDSLLESVLCCLFQCVQLSNIINEKITIAAVNSLSGLPSELWIHLSCKCDSIGRGLVTCFNFLNDDSQQRNPKTSYHHDVESLANLLLQQAKEQDFCNLFLIQESIPFSVEYFYQWLVTNDTKADILDEIAAAVSNQNVAQVLDVSTSQMFLSRTIQQHRRQGSPCKLINNDNASLSSLDEIGDDEEDEL